MNRLSSGLSRRGILAWAAVGAAGFGAVAVSALNRTWFTSDGRGSGSWWDRQVRSLDRAGLNEWSRHVGSVFELRTETGLSSFKLTAVVPIPEHGARPPELARDRGFYAVFEGDGEVPQGNKIYPVRHASGTLDIFFAETNPALPVAKLEATFN
jgi:hypothetical protein